MSMARKPVPTPADHARLSELVETIETAKAELHRELAKFYPKTALRPVETIDRGLSRIKADLDSRSCAEMGEPLWGTDIYYGPHERREAARQRLQADETMASPELGVNAQLVPPSTTSPDATDRS